MRLSALKQFCNLNQSAQETLDCENPSSAMTNLTNFFVCQHSPNLGACGFLIGAVASGATSASGHAMMSWAHAKYLEYHLAALTSQEESFVRKVANAQYSRWRKLQGFKATDLKSIEGELADMGKTENLKSVCANPKRQVKQTCFALLSSALENVKSGFKLSAVELEQLKRAGGGGALKLIDEFTAKIGLKSVLQSSPKAKVFKPKMVEIRVPECGTRWVDVANTNFEDLPKSVQEGYLARARVFQAKVLLRRLLRMCERV
jgi:hypothetical protein